MFLEAFFEWFSRGLPGGVFCGFVLVLRSLRWFFFGQVSGKYSFFPKNAEPRFLHTAWGTQLICKSAWKSLERLELPTVRWCSSRGSMAGLPRIESRGMCCTLAFLGAPMVLTVWPTIFSALECSHVADSFALLQSLTIAHCFQTLGSDRFDGLLVW